MHRSVKFPIDGKVRSLVRIASSQGLVDVDTKARSVTRVHHAIRKYIAVGKDTVGFLGVAHIFLYAKVVDTQVEMQRRRHADGAQIRGAVRPRADVIDLGEVGDLPQMRDAAGVHYRRSDIIDQLFLDQPLAIVNRIEYLADRERGSSVLPNQSKTFL